MEGQIFPLGTSPGLHGINDRHYTFINEIIIKVYCILLLNNLFLLLILFYTNINIKCYDESTFERPRLKV